MGKKISVRFPGEAEMVTMGHEAGISDAKAIHPEPYAEFIWATGLTSNRQTSKQSIPYYEEEEEDLFSFFFFSFLSFFLSFFPFYFYFLIVGSQLRTLAW